MRLSSAVFRCRYSALFVFRFCRCVFRIITYFRENVNRTARVVSVSVALPLGGEPPRASGLARVCGVPFLSRGISRWRAATGERAGACMWRTVSTVGTQILRGRVFFCNRVRLFSFLLQGISRRGARAGKCFGVMGVRLFPSLPRGISRRGARAGKCLGWSCTQVSLPFREIATSRVALLAMTRRYGCTLGFSNANPY